MYQIYAARTQIRIEIPYKAKQIKHIIWDIH